MSEPRQQPKVLLHRPKKSQRSPLGVSQKIDPSAASYTKDAGESNGTSKPSSSGTSSAPKQPIWYRFRTALTTLLVMNAVIVGYTIFRTRSKPSEERGEFQTVIGTTTEERERETQAEKEEKEEKEDNVKTPNVTLPEPPKLMQETTLATITTNGALKPKLLPEEQQEVFKWVLEERRKIRPRDEAEKAQLDAEKALLKEFIQKQRVLS